MRDVAAKELDRIESALSPGRGRLDLGAYARATPDSLRAAAFADYEHRITGSLSAFARAELGIDNGETFAQGLLGARWLF